MHEDLEVKIELDIKDDIAFLKFYNEKNKPNLINQHFITSLSNAFEELREIHKNHPIKGIIFTSAEENAFIAGIDYRLIINHSSKERLKENIWDVQQLFQDITNHNLPVVAAINGYCVGGGLEFVLACQYRIVSDFPRNFFMLPEVNLGIIPSFGGCVRLAKMLEPIKAIEVVCKSKKLFPDEALALGIVDEVVPPEILIKRAVYAINHWSREKDEDKNIQTSDGDEHKKQEYIVDVRKSVLQANLAGSLFKKFQRTKVGLNLIQWIAKRRIRKFVGDKSPAHLKALDVIIKSTYINTDDALKYEREAVAELLQDKINLAKVKSIVDTFIMKDELKELAISSSKDAKNYELPKKIGIFGAEESTAEIISLFTMNNVRVRVIENDAKKLSRTLKNSKIQLEKQLRQKVITKIEFVKKMDLINPSPEISGIRYAEFVLLNIQQNLEHIKEILANIENEVSDNAIIAINSSVFSVNELARISKKPENIIGINLLLPIIENQVIEVFKCEQTSEETFNRTLDLILKLKRIPYVVDDKTGLLINRIVIRMLNEVLWLILEGVSPEEIDDAMSEFGVKPCELLDYIGGQRFIGSNVYLADKFQGRYIPSGLASKMVEENYLGKIVHRGLYLYQDNDNRTRHGNAKISKWAKKLRFANNMNKKPVQYSREKIQERLICVLVNESVFVLEDGLVDNPRVLDAILVNAGIFSSFSGGLLKYADEMNLSTIVHELDKMHDAPPEYSTVYYKQSSEFKLVKSINNGKRFICSAKLRGLAENNGRFYPEDAQEETEISQTPETSSPEISLEKRDTSEEVEKETFVESQNLEIQEDTDLSSDETTQNEEPSADSLTEFEESEESEESEDYEESEDAEEEQEELHSSDDTDDFEDEENDDDNSEDFDDDENDEDDSEDVFAESEYNPEYNVLDETEEYPEEYRDENFADDMIDEEMQGDQDASNFDAEQELEDSDSELQDEEDEENL